MDYGNSPYSPLFASKKEEIYKDWKFGLNFNLNSNSKEDPKFNLYQTEFKQEFNSEDEGIVEEVTHNVATSCPTLSNRLASNSN